MTDRRKVHEYIATRERDEDLNESVKLVAFFEDGSSEPVPHLVKHSPTGLEFGYAGSGPADMARSIIGHYLGEKDPQPYVYQQFKDDFVAGQRYQDDFDASDQAYRTLRIPAAAIAAWVERFERVR